MNNEELIKIIGGLTIVLMSALCIYLYIPTLASLSSFKICSLLILLLMAMILGIESISLGLPKYSEGINNDS